MLILLRSLGGKWHCNVCISWSRPMSSRNEHCRSYCRSRTGQRIKNPSSKHAKAFAPEKRILGEVCKRSDTPSSGWSRDSWGQGLLSSVSGIQATVQKHSVASMRVAQLPGKMPLSTDSNSPSLKTLRSLSHRTPANLCCAMLCCAVHLFSLKRCAVVPPDVVPKNSRASWWISIDTAGTPKNFFKKMGWGQGSNSKLKAGERIHVPVARSSSSILRQVLEIRRPKRIRGFIFFMIASKGCCDPTDTTTPHRARMARTLL